MHGGGALHRVSRMSRKSGSRFSAGAGEAVTSRAFPHLWPRALPLNAIKRMGHANIRNRGQARAAMPSGASHSVGNENLDFPACKTWILEEATKGKVSTFLDSQSVLAR